MKQRILYYGGGWPTNIGNAFIDLGAIAVLKAAFPEAQINFASEMPAWLLKFAVQPDRITIPQRVMNRIPGISSVAKPSVSDKFFQNAFDIAKFSVCDLIVFAGMAMCEEFIQAQGPTIMRLKERGIPVLLLGTGGPNYDEREVKLFRQFLRALKPVGFISRDRRAFELYSESVDVSYPGIDCGFFVTDAVKPFSLDLPPYAVVNFDSSQEPELSLKGLLRVKTYHECFGNVLSRNVQYPRTLISDLPQDYLTLYANAAEVHSDRVHACVATLAYGNKARFYGSTYRSLLFDEVGAGKVTHELVTVDIDLLRQKKMRQVELVKNIIAEALNRKRERHEPKPCDIG